MQTPHLQGIATTVLAVIVLTVSIASAWAQDGSGSSTELAIPPSRIQAYLQSKFPRKFKVLGGLVSMTISNPQLDIVPNSDRLQMQFDAGSHHKTLGRVWLSSGLRYDPQTMELFLDSPSLERVVPTSGQELDSSDLQLVSLLLQDYASNEPIYHLDQQRLAHFGNIRVESARVANGQILVRISRPTTAPDLSNAQ